MWFPYFKGQPTDYIIRYSSGRLRGGHQGGRRVEILR